MAKQMTVNIDVMNSPEVIKILKSYREALDLIADYDFESSQFSEEEIIQELIGVAQEAREER
jgi:hypothetical protein